MLPFLDRDVVMNSGKPFIGCSDLTAILIYLTTCCGDGRISWPHACHLADGTAGYEKRSLLDVLSKTRADR